MRGIVKIITCDTDYAIRALCYASKHKNDVISVDTLSNCLQAPSPFLRKILQNLNKKGLLTSKRGRSGGFLLSKNPSKITMLDVVTAVQGPITVRKHEFHGKSCSKMPSCKIRRNFELIEKMLISKLRMITIESLM